VFYTRAKCHLCDSAWYVVRRAVRGCQVEVEQVDVDSDAALAARYGHDVPVVLVDGIERFRHRVDAEALRQFLSDPLPPE
jgi:hypothetical protein